MKRLSLLRQTFFGLRPSFPHVSMKALRYSSVQNPREGTFNYGADYGTEAEVKTEVRECTKVTFSQSNAPAAGEESHIMDSINSAIGARDSQGGEPASLSNPTWRGFEEGLSEAVNNSSPKKGKHASSTAASASRSHNINHKQSNNQEQKMRRGDIAGSVTVEKEQITTRVVHSNETDMIVEKNRDMIESKLNDFIRAELRVDGKASADNKDLSDEDTEESVLESMTKRMDEESIKMDMLPSEPVANAPQGEKIYWSDRPNPRP